MTTKSGTNLGLLAGAAPGDAHYTELTRFLRGMDALVQPNVISRVASVPTSGMADGDRYLVTGGANAGQIARYTVDTATPGWEFYAPKNGWYVWSTADQKGYRFKGSPAAWGEESTGGGGSTGDSYATKAISSGTLDISSSTANIWGVTLNQNVTTVTLPTPSAVQRLFVIFTQDATGGRTITWPSKVTFVNGMGTIATATSSITIVSLLSVDNGATWYATAAPSSSGGGGGMTNPMTAAGDLIVGGNAGDPQRLAIGAEGQVPTVVSGKLVYQTPPGGGGGGGSFVPMPIGGALTGSSTLTLASANTFRRVAVGGTSAVTLTIPPEGTTNFPIGTEFGFIQDGSAALRIAAGSGVTLQVPFGRIAQARTQRSTVFIKKLDSDYWEISGDLAHDAENSTPTASPISTIGSDRTLALSDAGKTLLMNRNTSAALTIAVPADSTLSFPDFAEINFIQFGTSPVVFTAPAGTTIYKPTGYNAKIAKQYGGVTLKRIAADYWILLGMLEVAS